MTSKYVHSLLAGGVLAVMAVSAPAGDAPCGAPCDTPCSTPCAAPCATAMRTVCVTERVPENYVCTRTVYKTECVQEKYTAYRTECYPETRTRTVSAPGRCPSITTCAAPSACRSRAWKRVPAASPCYTCKPVTTVCRKCEDHGHWECREVRCSGASAASTSTTSTSTTATTAAASRAARRRRRSSACGCPARCGSRRPSRPGSAPARWCRCPCRSRCARWSRSRKP